MNTTRNITTNSTLSGGSTILATALINVKAFNGEILPMRAFIDSGSQISCITESAAQILRLSRRPSFGGIIGIGAVQMAHARGIVCLEISSQLNDFSLTICAAVLSQVTCKLPTEPLPVENWPQLNELTLADPNYGEPSQVDILLGADVYGYLHKDGYVEGNQTTPHAQETKLGWILFGPIARHITFAIHPTISLVNALQHNRLDDLTELELNIKKLWELQEPLGVTTKLTQEEMECEDFFVKTVRRSSLGKYIVHIPFKSEPSTLGDSREQALRQFYRMEKRMHAQPELASKYIAFMDEYIELGHMQLANSSPRNSSRVYYLPHHAVLRKFRVVFNASAKTDNKISLNDIQMVGPSTQPKLFCTLLRFRCYRIGLSADIAKMYRQIRIHEDDIDLQRIFWRRNQNEPLAEYQLLTVTYGMASASFNAIRALQQCARDHQQQFSRASKAIMENFYCDDYLGGADSAQQAIELKNELEMCLSQGGFPLTKWKCNDWNVLNEFPEMQSDQREIDFDNETSSVLGLKWNVGRDVFFFTINDGTSHEYLTKRIMMSENARIYDPTGFLSPTTINGKIFIQRLWSLKIGFDDCVPIEIQNEWLAFRKSLQNINKISIPRWLGISSNSTMEIHIFCDASSVAYAAVAYARITNIDGTVSIQLITSRAKVAPVKSVSIPRLELCAAEMGVLLYHDIKEPLELQNEGVHFWTDSSIVLAWLNRLPNTSKVYVANRVTTILSHSNANQWKYIRTDLNPADCASRGISAEQLAQHNLWWKGPSFLQSSIDQWPNINFAPTEEEQLEILNETRTHIVLVNTQMVSSSMKINDILLVDRYSSLSRLKRVSAYVIRACNKGKPSHRYLTEDERDNALTYWIKHEQSRFFHNEIRQCQVNKELTKDNKLRKYGVFVDENGILRILGRLENAPISYNARHPIVLHPDSNLSKLLVADAHVKTEHGGTQLTLNILREKFWIINARKLVKNHRNRCVTCFRQKPILCEQRMADLPASRVTPNPAFDKSAVDLCGPFDIKLGNTRSKQTTKAYIAVFVCVVTKAIHLEMVLSLSTADFLDAAQRFMCRRGHCSELWSDNGTNFCGLNNVWKKIDRIPEFRDEVSATTTKWHFIPPGAPHFGGLHEAAVKSTKYHLKRIIGKQELTQAEMTTVLATIEACVNSRPIIALKDEPDLDEMVLTPGHFLIGRPLLAKPEPKVEEKCLPTRYNLVRRMQQRFWEVWKEEYLRSLQQRGKWFNKQPNIELGDVVLVKHESLPPTFWLLGKVIQLHPGKDGLVRAVTINTKKGEKQRPIQKLCLLPIK